MLRLSFPVLSTIDVYQQDAQVERYPENNPYRRVLEGIGIRQYEQLYPLSFQDRPKVFRRGRGRDPGSRGHHFFSDCQGHHH